MIKKGVSLLMALALWLTLLPASALAAEAQGQAGQEQTVLTQGNDGQTQAPGQDGAGEDDKTSDEAPDKAPDKAPDEEPDEAVSAVQALIDALPAAEDISDANADEVSGQLDAIDEAKQALTEEQAARLDLTGYDAAAAAVLAFVLSDRKRAYLILCGVLAVFWGAHMLACRRVGYADPVSDLTNFIRVAQLPVYTFSLITLFRRTPRFLDVLEDACTINLYLIAAVTLVSVLTGTCMPTYAKFRIGWCGWFWLPNSQSAILGVLTVIAMLAAVRRGKLPAAVMHCIVGFALLFLLGTRLAYAEIFGIAAGVCLSMALTRQWNVRALAVVLLCAALCGGLYHQSPMYRNRQAYAESVSEQQQAAEDLGASEQETRDALYWKYQRVAVERFGLENVEHAFHDSTDISVIGDIRLTKLVYCRLLMAELPATSRLFGFELDATRCQGAIFDAENDFHGVYYLYGLTGLVLLAGFLLFFAGRALWRMAREPRRYLTLPVCAFGMAAVILIVNAYFSASVLRRPNASFYLSAALAALYCLTAHDGAAPSEKEVSAS